MQTTEFNIYDVPCKSDVGTPMAYVGDVNPIHGGAWFDFSNVQYGYVDAVRVCDMDSEGVAIEHITILYDTDTIREVIASECCGRPKGREHIADALMWYGKYDPDDSWNGYQSHWSTVFETEEDFEAALPDHLF